jgi:hypothetical protein
MMACYADKYLDIDPIQIKDSYGRINSQEYEFNPATC